MGAAIPRRRPPVDIGGGIRLPTYAAGPLSHSWWAMVVLLLVAGSLFLAYVFSYLYLWTVSPQVWPEPASLAPAIWPLSSAALLLASGGAALLSARILPAQHASRIPFTMTITFGLFALGAALGLEAWTHRNAGLDPVADAHAAMVAMSLFLQAQLAVTAPDNDGDTATYSTPTGFDLDLDGRFGLPNGAGIKKTKVFQHNVNGYTGGRDTMLDERRAGRQLAWLGPHAVGRRRPQRRDRWLPRLAGPSPLRLPHRRRQPARCAGRQGGAAAAYQRPTRESERQHDLDVPAAQGLDDERHVEHPDRGDQQRRAGRDLAARTTRSCPTCRMGSSCSMSPSPSPHGWRGRRTTAGRSFPAAATAGSSTRSTTRRRRLRPQLTVNYTIVPEPAAALVALRVASGAAVRRRRS